MRYSYDDFKSIKCEAGLYCEVGLFGDDIYATKIYNSFSISNGYCECRLISREQFEAYPENVEELYKCKNFLCSNYIGKGHASYYFDSEKL